MPAPEAIAPPQALMTQTVTVRDFEFVPATVTIPRGTSIVWNFQGPAPHTSTADPSSPVQWDSGTMQAGGSYRMTFNTPGTFPYHCTIHPNMRGTIIVQ